MRTIFAVTAVIASVALASPASAAPERMRCVVSSPISAASLNAGATWSFEVFDAEPNLSYKVQVTWSGDPSNGGHPNAGIQTDATGYGKADLPAYWSPDGFLPGIWIDGAYLATPGDFAVRIGPRASTLPDLEPVRAGKTTCFGTVDP